ncbi:MAG: aconitase X [Beijerinckiaceae bacterium]|nr:aconitase X [Beijerinckiaceae bacterium]
MDQQHQSPLIGTALVGGTASGSVLSTNVELSFWGGVHPQTSMIVDRHHPLAGERIEGRILVMPGGRGSCSASGVMLELLLNGMAPAAMLFEREEDILTLGVLVARELFGRSIPVVTLSPDDFAMAREAKWASIDGHHVWLDGGDAISDHDRGSHRSPPQLGQEVALSENDKARLDGRHGEAVRSAMRIILDIARLQGASRLIDVSQVHIDACIYTGPASLAFAERLRELGGRVAVPTTLNAISVDREGWRAQGLEPAFGEPASRLADTYVDMGARPTFTCAPYLLDTAPGAGEQIAWSESNAVVFANSVLGARTMKYPDLLDACIALTGRAPLAGPHVEANRRATLRVDLAGFETIDDSFYPLLGYRIGELAGPRIPIVTGLQRFSPSLDDLKAFGAAFATTSSAPMFHLDGVTPEAGRKADPSAPDCELQSITVAPQDLRETWDTLNGAVEPAVELVALGNPHFSYTEVERLATLCRGRTKHRDVSLIITTGRSVLARASDAGLAAELEAFGATFVTDTCWCMITEPIIPAGTRAIMTNSAKYAHYGPGLTGRRFQLGSLLACVDAACTGHHDKRPPAWLHN